ncbi:sugar transferase [Kocuria oceani]|uniref:Sugar transferase n=1 Tax=Kocuria oceani TaxID=988827 RepID=A0ABV9TGZ0_9MICC|nr:sugar transferase [Kocuria oceani]
MLKVNQINQADVAQRPQPETARQTPSGRDWRRQYVLRMRWSDALALLVAMVGTQLVRFQLENAGLHLGGDFSVPYWTVGIVLAITWWVHLELRGARDVRLIGHGLEETRQVVNSTLVLFSAVAIVSFAFNIPTARSYVLIALPAGIGLLVLGRFIVRDRLIKERYRGESVSRTLVVGRIASVTELVQSLRKSPASGFDTTAVYTPSTLKPLPPELQRVQLPPNALARGERPTVEGIIDACHQHGIQTVVLSSNVPLSTREIRELSWLLTDERIRLVMDTGLTDIAGPRIHMQQVAGLPLIHVATPRMSRGAALVKRTMDVLGSAAALTLLSPVLAVLALIIKKHDGGPVFYAHERIGVDGKRFKVLKFRTMRTDAAEMLPKLLAESGGKALLFKVKNDPRITKPGHWLRRFSLDELPQFINVLKGDMSMVGPRPQIQAEVDEYDKYMHRRLRVKPGITGLWQVSGRNDLDVEQSVRLDLYYVENWSPLLDTLILVRTFKAVVAKDGAY